MKLSCMKYHRDLVAYADGELGPERAAGVERHVSGCSRCAAVVKEVRDLNALAPPSPIEPSADFDRVFWTRLAQARQEEAPSCLESLYDSARQLLTRPAGLSLAVGMAMAVFVVALYLMRPIAPAGLPQEQRRELMAAADLDLYANLDVIQDSEALENFELIEALDELNQDMQG